MFITGAGGTIGVEMCRQLLEHSPAKLILFELSEFALYELERELLEIKNNDAIEIVPVLGSITDARHVGHILKQNQVQIVLHAAAYKHVPLVEANALVGMENNVLGTHILASEAAKAGVARFILISSDKAVCPSNIMDASKRLAELIIRIWPAVSRQARDRFIPQCVLAMCLGHPAQSSLCFKGN